MKRAFIPGSEWLYIKLYTGIKSGDRLLADMIFPLAEHLLREKVINQWFFIRYADPKFHLRIRLKLSREGLLDIVLRTLYQMFDPLVEQGLVINISIDCYHREIERYGEKSMDLSEKYFFADSMAISGIIRRLRNTEDSSELRWLIGLTLIDDSLSAANYNITQKMRFIGSVDNAFREEFGINSALYTRPLNLKYRKYRNRIEEVMSHGYFYSQYEDILNQRREQMSLIFDSLMKCGGYSSEQLMPSYTHMTMNRLFRRDNRLCEMIVYYLLDKHYMSCVARQKNGS